MRLALDLLRGSFIGRRASVWIDRAFQGAATLIQSCSAYFRALLQRVCNRFAVEVRYG
jgi:hypothetical protein